METKVNYFQNYEYEIKGCRILIQCLCGCGKLIPNMDKYGRIKEYCYHHNPHKYWFGKHLSEEGKQKISLSIKSQNRYGSNNSHWKGGKIILYGYVLIREPNHLRANCDGYVREHILIMEKYLGRALKENEIVHHINHNRQDNRIENLKLMTKNEHSILHLKERKTHNQKCLRCGNNDVIKYSKPNVKKKQLWYCNKCSRYFTTISHSFIKWTKTGNIQMLSEQGYPYEILLGWKLIN